MQELKEEHKQVLEILFAGNLELTKLFMTSDGQAFTKEHRAQAWAKELGDNQVSTHYRDQVEKLKEVLAIVKDAVNGKGKKAGGFKAAFDQGNGGQGGQEPATIPAVQTTSEAPKNPEEKQNLTEGEGTEGQGEQGGSGVQPKVDTPADPKAEIKAARLKYEEVLGKKPNNTMTLETLNAKIAEVVK